MDQTIEQISQASFQPDVGFWLGPYMVAFFVDSMLAGVVLMQAIQYYQFSWATDPSILKYLICWLLFVCVAFTGFHNQLTWHQYVYGFGTWSRFSELTYLIYIPVLDALQYVPIQVFYSHRAWKLHQKNPIVLVVLGMFCTWSAIMPWVIIGIIKSDGVTSIANAVQQARIQKLAYVWLSSVFATDVVITGCIAMGLWKSRTGWSQTDSLVVKLILLSFETMAMPALITLGFVIEFAIVPSSSLGMMFELMLSKFYIAGIFVTLNTRVSLRRDLRNDAGSEDRRHAKSNTFARSNRLHQATVNVTTETYVEESYVPQISRGLNRDLAEQDIKEEFDLEGGHNLDYINNASKTGLTDTTQVRL